ncbi:RNA exonuclease ngl2 [Phytophthora pseudosyringae]|uniref:RNA exonuclease ngl2 n=1 Tax=Phytophthora pseudosyringae TaxID=221518 RepID=A0A8T1WDK3_9STRA|nr:RNA exonuclease ngl2 [Phytophthora pseudosyringae]
MEEDTTAAPPRQRQRSRRPASDGSSVQAEEKRQRTTPRKPRTIHRPWTLYAPPRSAEDPSVPLAASTFRFMSFNVLADYLVENDRKKEPAKRHQKYDWGYRSVRLVKEILRWSPHIVNLQEVDHFEDFFEPKLEKAGFVGVYKRRTGETTHDGCAIFVKKSMFRIVSSHPIEYHVPDHPVLNRDNIALTAVVEAKNGTNGSGTARFVVANTHLLFNPNRGEIKLAQLDMLLKHLTSLRQEHGPMLPILLSGDFNLAPHSPLYHFLSTGELDASGLSRYGLSGQNLDTYALKKAARINENDRARHNGNGTAFGKFNIARVQRNDFRAFKPSTTYSHEFDFASAYAQLPDDKCTGEPKFTIFHSGSKGTVDYIWYTRSSVHCHGVVEMIPAGLLFKGDELPTTEHSSDHLSLVADFSWR